MVANFLKLTGQTEGMDYKAKNFVHADLTMKEFEEKQKERNESLLGLALKASASAQDQQNVAEPNMARMLQAMYDAPGIGLAAPQIGVSLRLAVIDLAPDDKREPIVLVNPEIIARSPETATREEGCLSLPGLYADVTRPARVKVRFEDLAGIKREIEGDGLMAACLQHEIDHLDGVLFVDHLSALKRNMIMRKLAKEQKHKAGG
jgi:peptide deformylase